MIYVTTTKKKKLMQDATLHIEWHLNDETIRELAYHSHTFPLTVTDAELAIYESTIAVPGIVSALNDYLGQQLYTATQPLNDYVDASLLVAMDYGHKVITQFKRENVLMGISSTDKIPYVHDFLHNLNHQIEAGSAKEGIKELDRLIALPDTHQVSYGRLNPDGTVVQVVYSKLLLAPFITNARLTNFKNQLQDFYGMPRT